MTAPYNDLNLLHNIIDYKETCKQVSKIAFDAFKNHLWYLSRHCVALAFFDSRVPSDTKRAMVANLTRKASPGEIRPPLKHLPGKTLPKTMRKWNLPNFVDVHTVTFFDAFHLSKDFLSTCPETWPMQKGYQKNLEILKALNVVNDVAERDVALVKTFNATLTKSEVDFQNLLLVRKPDRKLYIFC